MTSSSDNHFYPLELDHKNHICLWDESGKFKWTIAYWLYNGETAHLTFVGSRPLDERVDWDKFKQLIEIGQKFLNLEYDEDQQNLYI